MDEAVNPLAPLKYTIVNRKSVFDLFNVFQECNHGIIEDLPVYLVIYCCT